MSEDQDPGEDVLLVHGRLYRGEGQPGDQEWLDAAVPKIEAMAADPQCPEGYGKWLRACLRVIKMPPFEIPCSECGRMKRNPAYPGDVQ